MKVCTKCLEPKALEDFYNSKKAADGKKWECKECSKKYVKTYGKANQAHILEKAKEWRKNNQEASNRHRATWAKKNPDKVKITAKKNREKYKDIYTVAIEKWRKANPAKCKATKARRRAAEKNASVVWADTEAINEIYRQAEILTIETGILHEIDHIHPLNHTLICGLHVESNLQILSQHDNRVKSNKFTPYVESED